MDICLDPFPYNGGTINIETLYAGIPYITLAGNNYVSRVGASILHQVGHSELIAKSEDAYVNLATTLAKDAPRLQKYKETLREDMMKSTLGDNAAFTRRFEDACEWMLETKKWFVGPRQPKLLIHE
jgi:predicted O-linked N-acetylglucosamine transferase (SPINDLY family)